MANPWEDYSNPMAAAIDAETQTPEEIAYLKSIFQQESGSGKNTKTSNAGAVGVGQIQPGTFKEVADEGWDIHNPSHNAQASVRYALKQLRAAGGDPKIGAAGYYGGPGGRIKAQQGQAVSDPRNPNAPNTLQYGDQVAERTGAPWGDYTSEAPPVNHAGMEHTLTPEQRLKDASYQVAEVLGPKSMANYKMAEEIKALPEWDKAMLNAGKEVSDLVSGINEIGYKVGGAVRDAWATEHPEFFPPGQDMKWAAATNDKINQILEERKANQNIHDIVSKNTGVSGNLGAMLPYMVDSFALGKPAAKYVGKALTGIAEAPLKAVEGGKSFLQRAVEFGAVSPNTPIRNIANRMKTEWTDPLYAAKIARGNRPVLKNPYLSPIPGEVGGGALIGAIEGGINPEQSIGEGTVNSALGAFATANPLVRSRLVHAPNYREGNVAEKEIVDWYSGKGGRMLPGMEFGGKANQQFENAMRNDKTFADPIARIDQANAKVDNRVAAEAMGLPYAKDQASFSPQELSSHMDKLKKEYDTLENNTTANFSPIVKTRLNSYLKSLVDDETQAGKILSRDVADYIKQIDQYTPRRDPLTGRMIPMDLKGAAYKDVRSRLQSDINQSFANGDVNRANALKPILKEVDDAVESGIRKGKGTATVNQWKDLNERFAMTNLVLDQGFTPTGQFNPAKMLSHFEGNDMKRMVTGQGGRIKELHNLAKKEFMDKEQFRSNTIGATSRNVFNQTNPTTMQALLKTPFANYAGFSGFPQLALKAYTSGWPVQKGLLNMSGKTWKGTPAMYSRAYSMGNTHPFVSAYNTAEEGYNWTKDKYNKSKEEVENRYRRAKKGLEDMLTGEER